MKRFKYFFLRYKFNEQIFHYSSLINLDVFPVSDSSPVLILRLLNENLIRIFNIQQEQTFCRCRFSGQAAIFGQDYRLKFF